MVPRQKNLGREDGLTACIGSVVYKEWQITHRSINTRVARWYIFKPNIPVWVNFGGPGMEYVGIFMAILSIVQPNGIFYGIWSIVVIWYIFPSFGMLYREKSGNPDQHTVGQTTVYTQFDRLLVTKQEQAFALWLSEA
jgi:hypothetical protein